jgi:adenylate cyclase class 2
MKEIEIKIQIDSIEKAIQALEGLGCHFSDAISQVDVIYIPKDQKILPVPAGTSVLRIRTQQGKILFTLKQSDLHNHLSKTEKELEITDGQVMGEIIALLGFHEISRVEKKRRTCKFKDYEICLDSVRGLGDFMEIEKITDEDPIAVQTNMIQALAELGVDASRRMQVGYDVLMYQQHGKGN